MKKTISIILVILFTTLLGISAYHLITYKLESDEQADLYEGIADELLPEGTETSQNPFSGQEEEYVLPDYSGLQTQNSDFVGWIRVQGTRINYPVCQSGPNDPNYYLHHNFYKQYSVYGCPYMQQNCGVDASDNLIIYGHHMNDGSMFATLDSFTKKSFYNNNNIISFDTPTEHREYKIVCVFKTTVYNRSGYRFYDFVNALDEADFNKHIETCRSLQLYETGETAQYGHQLITLSTCEYSRQNGRLVIVGSRIA